MIAWFGGAPPRRGASEPAPQARVERQPGPAAPPGAGRAARPRAGPQVIAVINASLKI